jgi:hypothetical protein
LLDIVITDDIKLKNEDKHHRENPSKNHNCNACNATWCLHKPTTFLIFLVFHGCSIESWVLVSNFIMYTVVKVRLDLVEIFRIL